MQFTKNVKTVKRCIKDAVNVYDGVFWKKFTAKDR